MSLGALAVTTGLLPFLTAHLSYLISSQADLIPTCITYLTGCTSVSASGRHGWAFFLYKGGMIPSALLLAAYWVLARRWLLALGARDSAALRTATALGVVSGVFYVLYALFVGVPGEVEVLLRRTGAAVHLAAAMLAQILATGAILTLPEAGRSLIPPAIRRAKLLCVAGLVVLTMLLIPIESLVADKDRGQNVIEWHFTTLMVAYYVLSGVAWRACGFRAVLGVGSGRNPGISRDA